MLEENPKGSFEETVTSLELNFRSGQEFKKQKAQKTGIFRARVRVRGEVLLSTGVQRRDQFEFGNHEIQQMLPTFKIKVAGQGTQIIKEGFTDAEFGTQ